MDQPPPAGRRRLQIGPTGSQLHRPKRRRPALRRPACMAGPERGDAVPAIDYPPYPGYDQGGFCTDTDSLWTWDVLGRWRRHTLTWWSRLAMTPRRPDCMRVPVARWTTGWRREAGPTSGESGDDAQNDRHCSTYPPLGVEGRPTPFGAAPLWGWPSTRSDVAVVVGRGEGQAA